MSIAQSDIDFAVELFAGLGPLTIRKMMGGLCLYRDGVIFALIYSDGTLMLKGAGEMADRMVRDGWTRWSYTRPNGTATHMPYWAIPDAALDDPELACDYARQALAAL